MPDKRPATELPHTGSLCRLLPRSVPMSGTAFDSEVSHMSSLLPHITLRNDPVYRFPANPYEEERTNHPGSTPGAATAACTLGLPDGHLLSVVASHERVFLSMEPGPNWWAKGLECEIRPKGLRSANPDLETVQELRPDSRGDFGLYGLWDDFLVYANDPDLLIETLCAFDPITARKRGIPGRESRAHRERAAKVTDTAYLPRLCGLTIKRTGVVFSGTRDENVRDDDFKNVIESARKVICVVNPNWKSTHPKISLDPRAPKK